MEISVFRQTQSGIYEDIASHPSGAKASDKKYQDLEFEINYELNTMDIESYEIPSSKEDIKLN